MAAQDQETHVQQVQTTCKETAGTRSQDRLEKLDRWPDECRDLRADVPDF